MDDLRGLKVLAVGGGSGIGRAFARLAHAAGAAVAVADLEAGDDVDLAVDVTDDAACAAAVAAAIEALGGLDVLAISAGVARFGAVGALAAADYLTTYGVNVVGAANVVRHARPALARSTAPAVVTVSSAVGGRTYPGSAAYGTSKAALVHWSQVAANELAGDGIRVNCVCPGPIDTAMLRAGCPPDLDVDDWLAGVGRGTALGRVGLADEVAHAMVFLASRHATFITGAVLAVDGGEQVYDRQGSS